MKKSIFLVLIALALISCKKEANGESTENLTVKGHAKLFLNNQKIFDEDCDTHYLSPHRSVTFGSWTQSGVVRLSGGISNVPDIGGSNGIESDPANADTSPLSYIQIDSDTGEFIAPGNNVIRIIIGQTGQVTRPDKNHVIYEGTCIETDDLINTTSYNIKLEITIEHFNS